MGLKFHIWKLFLCFIRKLEGSWHDYKFSLKFVTLGKIWSKIDTLLPNVSTSIIFFVFFKFPLFQFWYHSTCSQEKLHVTRFPAKIFHISSEEYTNNKKKYRFSRVDFFVLSTFPRNLQPFWTENPEFSRIHNVVHL